MPTSDSSSCNLHRSVVPRFTYAFVPLCSTFRRYSRSFVPSLRDALASPAAFPLKHASVLSSLSSPTGTLFSVCRVELSACMHVIGLMLVDTLFVLEPCLFLQIASGGNVCCILLASATCPASFSILPKPVWYFKIFKLLLNHLLYSASSQSCCFAAVERERERERELHQSLNSLSLPGVETATILCWIRDPARSSR
jgi:hypothetical protein